MRRQAASLSSSVQTSLIVRISCAAVMLETSSGHCVAMEHQPNWSNSGKVANRHNIFRAEIDTKLQSTRYYIAGPSRRQHEQQAQDDLARIRLSAVGSVTRHEALQAMKMESQSLQMEAKATRDPQGCIKEGAAYSSRACIQYWDDLGKHTVRGPSRAGRRRAEADLSSLVFWESAASLGPNFLKA